MQRLNQGFSYDPFGNMISSGNFNFQQAYTTANQLSGWSYDASGNLLNDGLGHSFGYDAEGRISSLNQNANIYVYDAEGNRVSNAATNTDHIYFGGREIARLSGGQWTDLIYGVNGLLAEVPGTQSGAPVYRILDHLGTAVGTLSSTGVLLSTTDYAPFGQVFSGGSTDPYKFTGKERDAESGNDYFGARYYGSSMGRWMSPDWAAKATPVPYAKLDNPQSLNLYAYVGNNPLSRVDPDGHCDAPSGLKPGQVGICVASYIRTTWFKLIGRGDGRDTNGNGGTARIETHLVVDPQTGKVTNQGDIVGRSGVLLKDAGPKGTGESKNTQGNIDEHGNVHFQVSQDAHSFYAADGAFLGSIDNKLNLQVTPDQKVGIDSGSTAKDFPSLEVYRYTTDGTTMTTTLVTNKYESGNGDALKLPESPLPTQAPQ